MNIFDEQNHIVDFTIVLSTRNYEHLGAIRNADPFSITYSSNLNAKNELSFKVYKIMDAVEEQLWDKLTDFKLVWVKELNEYFEVNINMDDSDETVKSVSATSLCEAELGQTMLYDIEINTEDDIAREHYKITKFYHASNHDASLLHRILSKTPHYTIKHVDASLTGLQRSFSVDGTSVYDFLVGECAEQFHCLFRFDSTDRSISVYDLYTVCNHCGHRGEYSDACPECGSSDLNYFGKDTSIYVDKENLTASVSFETDADSTKNCFKLVAGDELMTAAIRSLNQNGSDYIYHISDEQKDDMPDELVKKIISYDSLYESYTDEYQKLMEDLYESVDKILYYSSSMMPDVEHAEVTASTEIEKLTAEHLSPLGLSNVTSSTSVATVNSAIRNYAKVYVKTGYVKIEVNEGVFQYAGIDNDGYSYGMWTGKFKITNYSDKEDVAISPEIRVKVYDDYRSFLEQKIRKSIAADNDDDNSVYDVLSIHDLKKFREALKQYCRNRLTSFYDAIQGVLDVLIQVDQANEAADFYESMYLPYYEKLQACQAEIDARQATIDEWQHIYDNLEMRKNEIQSELNFEKYLGGDLYPIFCAYRREDTYSNSNYISNGLDNTEIFEHAREFMETAKKELYKSGELQHSISSSLHNLLLMQEFKPLAEQFELGNWIRVGVDGNVYRLRLIGFTVDCGDPSNLNVTFSDVTRVRDGISDLNNIVKSVQSMATGYDTVRRQAEKGKEARDDITDWTQNGLDSASIQIKNNDKEEVAYDKYGLSAKEYDDISESYSPEQVRVTHNCIVMTDDGWKSSCLAIGRHNYIYYDESEKNFKSNIGYGVSAKFLNSPYIYGGQFIGGDIYSDNYSPTSGSHLNLRDGTFSFAGGNLVFDGVSLGITSPDIPSEEKVTKIIKNTVTANYINSLNITADSVAAENITGTTFSDKIFSGGCIVQNGISSALKLQDGEILGGHDSNYENRIDFGNCISAADGTKSYGMALIGDNLLQIKTPRLFVGTEDADVCEAKTASISVQTDTGLVLTLVFKNGILVDIHSENDD